MSTSLVVADGYISQQPIGDTLLLQGDIDVSTYIITASADLVLEPVNALRASSSGDPRGINAVDLQQVRDVDLQVASGDYAVLIGGRNSSVTGESGTVGGGDGHKVPGDFSTILSGESNQVDQGNHNFIGGGAFNRIDTGNYNVIFAGYLGDIENSSYVFVGSGYKAECNTSNYVTMLGGEDNDVGAGANYSTILGGRQTAVNKVGDASGPGDYSFIGTGYISRIDNAAYTTFFAGQSIGTRKGFQTHGTIFGGRYSDCTGSHAVIGGGVWNDADGAYSVSMCGRFVDVNGDYSAALTGINCSLDSDYGSVWGKQSAALNYGEGAHSAGITTVGAPFGTARNFQTATLVARNTSTDSSDTVLYLDGISEVLTIGNKTTWLFDAYITGHRDTSLESSSYQIQGVIRKYGTVDAPVLVATVKTVLAEDDVTWDANVRVNTVSKSLEFYVNGAAGKTINWVARVELTMSLPYMLRKLIIRI